MESEGYVPSKFKVVPKFTSVRANGWDDEGGYAAAFRREVQHEQEDVFWAEVRDEAGSAQRAVAEEVSAFGKA